LLLLLAAALRWSGVVWDGGIGAHPDERYVVGLSEGLAWPDRLDPFAFDPAFPYGHLPLYLLALLGSGDRLLAARLLAGLADAATVAVTAALGYRLGGRRAGLLAGGLLAVMPLHVQQAHFATVDPFLALFVTAALLFAARAARGTAVQPPHRVGWGALAGACAGLAVGCKGVALLLALPLVTACAVAPCGRQERLRLGLAMAGATLLAFALTNPFALLELPRFLRNLADQAALARGTVLAPYTLQYRATQPYLYPISQWLIWGMGPLLGLFAVGGLAAAVLRARRVPPAPVGWVLLAWALPFFAFVGALFVKLPRYLLPLTPVMAIYATGWLRARRNRPPAVIVTLAAVLALTASLSLSLVSSYRQPHPWVAASAWLEAHLPAGSVVAVEEWDHPLPLHPTGYDVRVLPVFDEESDEKWAEIEQVLSRADVVIIASRRGYGALARWPERFPRTAAYYQALFAGERGFQVVACFGRWPRLAGLALADDPFSAAALPLPAAGCQPAPPVLWLPRLDESLVVYDHPLVVVLARRGVWYNPNP